MEAKLIAVVVRGADHIIDDEVRGTGPALTVLHNVVSHGLSSLQDCFGYCEGPRRPRDAPKLRRQTGIITNKSLPQTRQLQALVRQPAQRPTTIRRPATSASTDMIVPSPEKRRSIRLMRAVKTSQIPSSSVPRFRFSFMEPLFLSWATSRGSAIALAILGSRSQDRFVSRCGADRALHHPAANEAREERIPVPLIILAHRIDPRASSVGRVPIERLARAEQSLTARIGDRDQGVQDRRVE